MDESQHWARIRLLSFDHCCSCQVGQKRREVLVECKVVHVSESVIAKLVNAA